jgi:glucose-6-phosphate 1-dehydrogenase
MTQPAGPLLDVIIFGGTGDLSLRKLLPALYQLTVEGHTTQIRKILCCARHPISRDELHQKIAKSFAAHKATVTETGLGTFLQHVDYAAIDVYQPPSYVTLTDSIEQYDLHPKLFYFATAPELYGPICRQLSQQNLITKGSRVVLEKPIGSDLESCKTINAQVGEAFSESAIFRIDHYLGKETVQNLIALRFGNSLLAPIWNSQYISNVQITVAETVGIEGRTSYYTKVGAFKDMVQNHLLQLLCLVAMEPPNSLHADAIRDEKVKVLRALAPFDDQTAQRYTVRGQYQQGNIQGEYVRAYGEEINDITDSHTETFCALKICVDNWRWTGVPFYVRTGKRLARRFSEIVIEFKPQPFSIFERGNGESGSNRLLIRLQPEENITLWMFGKKPELAPSMSLQSIPLDLTASHRADNDVTYDAYVRLLLDVINNNQTLFMRRDEVETAWSWADSLVGAWQVNAQPPLSYPAGGMGPEAAARLIGHDNLRWFAG